MTKSRRTFLKVAGLAGTALINGVPVRPAWAQANTPRVAQLIQTPTLVIGYEEDGDTRAFPTVLLHGFPDDVRAWDEVVPRWSRPATAY